MKAKELIYNLKTSLLNTGSKVEDMTDQHLMYMLDSSRAILASQKLDKAQDIIPMSQFIDIKPIKATSSEIGTIGDTAVLKVPIPKPVAYSNGIAIFTVGPTDGEESYTQISFSQLRTALHRKYTKHSPKWFFLENSIYIINVSIEGIQKVRVRGIFDEPYKVEVLMNRYKHLDPFNFEYPLTLKDTKTLYQLAITGELGWGDVATQAINAALARQQSQEKQEQSQE